jgi:hypothetical protein
MKTVDRIKADPRVSDVWNEGDDGWWVLLKGGFICGHSDAHAVHERTIKSLLAAFKTVKPCSCADCKK